MIVLLFGSEECEKCKKFMVEYLALFNDKYQFLYIDIEDDDNEDLCNLLDVWESPHVFIVNNIEDDDMDIIFEQKDYFHPKILSSFLSAS